VKIVLGLGNPGGEYTRTRHNLGFRVVDLLGERAGVRIGNDPDVGRAAWVGEATIADQPVLLAKPRTYMNRSGSAAAALLSLHKATPDDLIVVYDDADLALGRVRVRGEGRAGGHNGIRSLLDVLRTETFPRVKLGVKGIGREESDLADYVLEPFLDEELPLVEPMIERGADAVALLLEKGLVPAMNAFNPPA
jgi:peptidyl-tRNA hydrolase, PTH1 family